jgi:hypothetical protein
MAPAVVEVAGEEEDGVAGRYEALPLGHGRGRLGHGRGRLGGGREGEHRQEAREGPQGPPEGLDAHPGKALGLGTGTGTGGGKAIAHVISLGGAGGRGKKCQDPAWAKILRNMAQHDRTRGQRSRDAPYGGGMQQYSVA